MKSLYLAGLALLAATCARGALAELNPADGTINTPDGSFAGRDFTIVDGFKLELLYLVPPTSGSWFQMAWDDRRRLIVSSHNTEQMFRLNVPPVGSNSPLQVENVDLAVGSAHGLVYLNKNLYVTVNNGQVRRSGVYRVTDTDNDDKFDQVRVIRNLSGGGQHGQHTLKLGPDGQNLFLINGDDTPMTPTERSRVPKIWGEDSLIRRVANMFNNYQLAPQAWIASFDPAKDPEGKNWELFAMGMRNPVSHAFNKDGELFVYDADHELDMGDPWYRPTAVFHATSGSDFGFRLRASKHPFYYVDYRAPVAIIGAGSPTGNTFGTGAKFPARYQDSFIMADSSYGNLWAVHMSPWGSSYKADVMPFASGRPFGVYGVLVNPTDGTLLVTTGSALFRVSYIGNESTEPTKPDTTFADRRNVRKNLEKFHGHTDAAAVDAAWPYLNDADPAIRYAARTAIEWQPVATWRDRALNETNPQRAIEAVVALSRVTGRDEYHRAPDFPAPDKQLQSRMFATLDRIDWKSQTVQDKLDILRAYHLAMIRLGSPDEATRQRLIAKFDPFLPAPHRELNWELAETLIYLEAPSAATKVMALLRDAPSPAYFGTPEYPNPILRPRAPGTAGGVTNLFLSKQEDQIHYAQLLRGLQAGWTRELREEYLRWFPMAFATYSGGSSFQLSIQTIRTDAIAMVPADERQALQSVIDLPLVAGGRGGRGGAGGGGAAAPAGGAAPAAPRGGGL